MVFPEFYAYIYIPNIVSQPVNHTPTNHIELRSLVLLCMVHNYSYRFPYAKCLFTVYP